MNDETVLVRRELIEEILVAPIGTAARRAARAELESALMTGVPWDLARPLVAELKVDLERHGVVHGADQLEAYAAGRLAELGVDVRDPRVLYETLVVLVLVRELARNGRENDVLTLEEENVIGGLVRAVASALTVLVPPEGQP